jgi:hypothetical protein
MAELSASYNLRTAYFNLLNGLVLVSTELIPVYRFAGLGKDNTRVDILRITEGIPDADACNTHNKDCLTEIDIVCNLSILRQSDGQKKVDDIANAVMSLLVPSLGYVMTVSDFDNDSHYFLRSEEITEIFEGQVYLHRIMTYRDLLTQTT